MDRWTIMAPYARLVFSCPDRELLAEFEEALAKIPGTKVKQNAWSIPENALSVVNDLQALFGVGVARASWGRVPQMPTEWEDVLPILKAGGEVQPGVLEHFLTEYQKEAIAFGWSRTGVHLWHATGAGKTLTSFLVALSQPGLILEVTRAPAKVQHARQARRFLTLEPYVLKPASTMRKKDQTLEEYLAECQSLGRRPLVITGWPSVSSNLHDLIALHPGSVIFDEVHQAKSSKRWDIAHLLPLPDDPEDAMEQASKEEAEARASGGFIKETETGRKMFLPILNRASAAAELARAASKRIASTATPVADRVRDLWSQLDLVEPNAWGNATIWMDRHADRRPCPYGGFDSKGSSNLEELRTRLCSVAHILPYSVTHRQLPPKRRQSLYVSPEDQCKVLGSFKQELKSAYANGPTAVLEVKLAMAASSKREAVLDLIVDHLMSDQKVVVFTGRRKDCEVLGASVKRAVEKQKPTAMVWSAHGGQSQEYRQECVDGYMAHPGPCVLVGTGHAFGESLDLHDTDAALLVMLPYTPGMLRQWEGRFCRLGQKRAVIIYYVIAEGTVDEHVASILIDKLPAVENVAGDSELGEARSILAGMDGYESDDSLAAAVLAKLDGGVSYERDTGKDDDEEGK